MSRPRTGGGPPRRGSATALLHRGGARLGRRGPLALGRPPMRLHVALGCALLVLVVLGGRLVQLQGLDAPAYAAQAEKQRLQSVVLPAPRGEIVDRHGVRLAETVGAEAVYADPKLVVNPVGTAAALAPVLGLDQTAVQTKITRPGRFVYLARALDPEVGRRVADLRLAGIALLPESKRIHPGHELAASVVGFTGQEGQGLAGIEVAYDKLLSGADGRQTMEVDHVGRQIPSGQHSRVDPVAGHTIGLTLDRDIQWQAEQALSAQLKASQAKSGTVVVMDPRTGEVFALAGAPGFDADNPAAVPASQRGNPAVSDVYEPGSVNKVITAAAALQTGTVTPDTPVTVPPTLDAAGHTFHDAEPHGTEHLTFSGVLAKSSNIGTIEVAQQLGKSRLYDYLRSFGFGLPTGTRLPGESGGLLPPADKWSATQALTIPFGQGVSVTALQVASVFSTVANGGVRVPPRLVEGTVDAAGHLAPAPALPPASVINAHTAEELRLMMEAVTSNEGTAPAARIDGYRVAGKTGTSQRVDPTCGCYRGYTASFVGMAPADNPQLVVEVVVQDPQNGHFGGDIAAPVFHDVMSFALQARQVPPTGTTAPPIRLTTD